MDRHAAFFEVGYIRLRVMFLAMTAKFPSRTVSL